MSKFAIIVIAGSLLAAVFALLVVPYLTTSAQQPENEHRRIVAFESKYDAKYGQSVTHVNYVRAGDMEPNSARWFLDPFGKTMEGRSTVGSIPKPGTTINASEWTVQDEFEAFEIYTIIRLPELFGGSDASVTSYRAYNTISITDQCLSKYWQHEGRWHIANPCAGDIYRSWDGVAIAGPAAVGISGRGIISAGQFSALASLDLAVDSEGYITAKRPSKGYTENGMPGEGRRLSFGELQESASEMLDAASGYQGYQLPFPPSISGKYFLSDLRVSSGIWWYGEWRDGIPQVIEAVYNFHQQSSSSNFDQITVTTYPIQDFPELALNSPAMANEVLELSASDLDAEARKLNMTSVNSLIQMDETSLTDLAVRATTDVGIFSVYFSSLRMDAGGDLPGSGALIWATTKDGKIDQLVTIRARTPVDMNVLKEVSQTLQIQ